MATPPRKGGVVHPHYRTLAGVVVYANLSLKKGKPWRHAVLARRILKALEIDPKKRNPKAATKLRKIIKQKPMRMKTRYEQIGAVLRAYPALPAPT